MQVQDLPQAPIFPSGIPPLANSYNSCPIKIDTVMASGWKGLQTLNTGNLPSTAQQFSGAVVRQPGLRVFKVEWDGATTIGHTFSIIDPNDNTILLNGTANAASQDIQYDFTENPAHWRDFKVTTLASGILYIWYRS